MIPPGHLPSSPLEVSRLLFPSAEKMTFERHIFAVMYFAFNQFFFLEGEIYILLKRKDPQIQLSTASGNPFQFSILSRNMLRPTM